jgi:signal transduction histidine kinase
MFAARVAHDLRAPLAVLEMRTASAQRASEVGPLKETVDRIGRQGRRLAEIVDALFEFAQAGARPAPGQCAAIAEIIDDVASDCRSIATEAHLTLSVDPVPPATAACSSAVLGIVLSNLVHNAAKYVGEVEPRVAIRVRVRDSFVRFEVEDNGPGLPPGTETAIFEPFVRASNRKGGIGLGLATVKRLVEAHGGSVGVVSSPGCGCTFWFEMPGVDPERASPTSVEKRAAYPAQSRIAAG